MREHHYLKGGRSAGDTLRYIAEIDGRTVALLTWGAAAYKLKDRDNWIGWNLGLRKQRLKLVVQNRRFCLLTAPGEQPNLASQVLGACLRRLPADWVQAFGYRPLVAETFVDPQYAQGTCYKATNWQQLGVTAGSGRHARDFYQQHDRPKTLWCLELVQGARQKLADPAPLPAECQQGVITGAVMGTAASAATCKSLMALFAQLPDPRGFGGRRYPQRQLLSILALGMICGCQTLQAIVILGQSLSQMQLRALGGIKRKKTGVYEVPSYNAYYNLIGQMDAVGFDAALCAWLSAHEGSLPRDLALDGKVLCGTADADGHRLALIALIENQTQRLVAQQPTQVIHGDAGSKQEGELTAARRLLQGVPSLDHATITGDAMFARKDIAQTIVQDKGGDYLLALKDNNPTLAAEVRQRFEQAIEPPATGPENPAREHPFFGKAK
ncbi:MAG: ISAs1 family transposase [Prosthecobacter sp.]|uniref:ISAs1 family transposase n=1 Tax=Prosthecobacter sp. TaxID=1965333 RepID=UPI0038FFA4D8